MLHDLDPLKVLGTFGSRGPSADTRLLLFTIWSFVNAIKDQPLVRAVGKPPLPQIVSQLIRIWSWYGSYHLLNQNPLTNSTKNIANTAADEWVYKPLRIWDQLNNSATMAEIRCWSTKDYRHRLERFLTQKTNVNNLAELSAASLATFAILRQFHQDIASVLSDVLMKQVRGYVQFITQLISHSNLSLKIAGHMNIYSKIFNNHLDSLKTVVSITETLRQEIPHAVTITAEAQVGDDNKEARSKKEPAHDLINLFAKRVARAVEQRNLHRLESIQIEFDRLLKLPGRQSSTSPSDRERILSDFIAAYVQLRSMDRAVKVWNEVIESNLQPNIRMADSMLKGFGASRSIQSVNDTWDQIRSWGIDPDVRLWGSRINALAVGGNVHMAIDAFKEMAAMWLKENADRPVQPAEPAQDSSSSKQSISRQPDHSVIVNQPDIPGAPKPNSYCVNMLVQALATRKMKKELVPILAMARKLNIKADTYTFNSLIKMGVEDGDSDFVSSIFIQMTRLGIKPDVATFTVLLQAVFQRHRGQITLENQQMMRRDGSPATGSDTVPEATSGPTMDVHVEKLLDLMTSSDVEANPWTFNAIIDGLLRSPTAESLPAAYAILSHVQKYSLPHSCHIYTSMISYHFRKDSPDSGAIQSLWQSARRDRGVVLDVAFFDRLIEGFGRHGEIGNMMTALTQAGKQGKAPGWPAMTAAVEALSATGDMARCNEIVEAVRRDEARGTSMRSTLRKGHFWELVENLGLGGQHADTDYHVPTEQLSEAQATT